MKNILLILFLLMLLAVVILSGFYFYQTNGKNLLPGFLNFGTNKVYSLDEALNYVAKDCKIIFPESESETNKTLSIEELSTSDKDKMKELTKYYSNIIERAGIKDRDNLEYIREFKVSNTEGCRAIIYTKESNNYFVYEKSNGSIVKLLVNKVQ